MEYTFLAAVALFGLTIDAGKDLEKISSKLDIYLSLS